jgi:hypothetical protein
MFQASGAWKEFGYKRAQESRHTIFPIWLFAIVWAILSYAIAAAVVTVWVPGSEEVAIAAATTAYMSNSSMPFSNGYDDESEATMLPVSNFAPTPDAEAEEDVEMTSEFVMPTRRPRGRPRKQPRPGYYVLDPASREGGLHQYVYYGSNPPANGVATTRVEA